MKTPMIFFNHPGNSTSFLNDPWNFHMFFLLYPWKFHGLADLHPDFLSNSPFLRSYTFIPWRHLSSLTEVLIWELEEPSCL